MASNHAPSPWGNGRMTPAVASNVYRNLIKEIKDQIYDEEDAAETYNRLSKEFEEIGDRRAAETLRIIAGQEAKHKTDLQFILGTLEMQLGKVR